MQFEVKENVIIIKDFTQFNIQQILECGQFFRFIKTQNGYEIYSLDKYAYATVFEDRCEITCTDVNYFINFFDLDADYNQIKHNLVNINNYLNNAISYGYGIRILKQDIFEMFITFIISANNNIKRIQNSVFKLCEMFGTNMKNYFAFPTYSQLLNASIQDFIYCGLGYRAEQLYKALRQLKTANLNNLNNLDSNQLSIELQKFSGIGPKVADCIMLFGYGRQDVFPVDTWIEKAYNAMFKTDLKNRIQIRKKLVKKFNDLSGYAQQYLFYYKRTLK